MKKRLFFLFPVSLFLISLLGAFWVSEEKTPPKTAAVTVCARFCDNALADALEDISRDATLDGAACKILSLTKKPSTVCKEDTTFPSRLYSDIFFLLEAEVTLRESAPYAGGSLLSPGKRVLLSSMSFYGECEILSVEIE